MNKTKIDWTDYTVNPIKGLCKGKCFYCYARAMYRRFKWKEKIRLEMPVMKEIEKIRKSSKIFICSTHDLFGEWIDNEWIYLIVGHIFKYPQHIFQFLTKNPKRYWEFSMPDNCWRGVTITKGIARVFAVLGNGIRFASFEPLLGKITMRGCPFDWIIIGGMTGPGGQRYQPKKEWIEDILRQADESKTPVFMKSNLKTIWKGKLRQEFPKHNAMYCRHNERKRIS